MPHTHIVARLLGWDNSWIFQTGVRRSHEKRHIHAERLTEQTLSLPILPSSFWRKCIFTTERRMREFFLHTAHHILSFCFIFHYISAIYRELRYAMLCLLEKVLPHATEKFICWLLTWTERAFISSLPNIWHAAATAYTARQLKDMLCYWKRHETCHMEFFWKFFIYFLLRALFFYCWAVIEPINIRESHFLFLLHKEFSCFRHGLTQEQRSCTLYFPQKESRHKAHNSQDTHTWRKRERRL